jgi:type I restriction enzyme R subunit
MTKFIVESDVEERSLGILADLGYATAFGPDISPGEAASERATYADVVLEERLLTCLQRLNPAIPLDVLDEAVRKLTRISDPNLALANCQFHKWLVEGVPVEYQGEDGRTIHDSARLLDYDDPHNNDFLAVNQFTVIEAGHNRRADIVLFVNGLPLGVIELKNPGDEKATIEGAFNQLQTYKHEIASLFHFNEVLIVSDGVNARAGTLTGEMEWFLPWRTVDGTTIAPMDSLQLDVVLKGMLEPSRFLDLVRYFVVFNIHKSKVAKKMAGYHQYHAANKAVECTLKAASPNGDRRVGVVWHTQGTGKSLTMAFFAGKVIQQREMENPTLIVLTDRNDLDDQLFDTFAASHELLRQEPVQAQSRAHLRELLKRSSGGVIFTTIQKFVPEERGDALPMLSERRNIVFIADEAHRSQYGFITGFARRVREVLPNASFIGFTGTPIEKKDRSTRAVFGNYIDVYDIVRGNEDGATVPIFYESRLAKLDLRQEEKPVIDEEFEEITEQEEETVKKKLKTKWGRLEAVVGSERRLKVVAEDIVEHFANRQEAMEPEMGVGGKAMIVCMSRRICVALYNELVKLRPHWNDNDDRKGFIKVVMTGGATDPVSWQQHIRNKQRREEISNRFKDENDPLSIVIVRDMWLTGFDVPCLHTMYVDKPMRGHGLMQAIARVNRVYKEKPGGLIVDYLGLGNELKQALANYSESDREQVGIDQEEAVNALLARYEVIRAMFHGFDYSRYFAVQGKERLSVIPSAMEHILKLEDGKKRFMQAVTELMQAFALAVPNERALNIRDEVGFFQTLRASFVKSTTVEGKSAEQLDAAMRQIVSRAVASNGVTNVFEMAGLKKFNLSILSEEFLAELRGMPQKNLAVEALAKLLKDEIKARFKTNVVQERMFSDLLEESVRRYQNRAVEAKEIIEELIQIAKRIKEAQERGEELGLTDDEVAFYDALAQNDSAVQVLGVDELRAIARILVERVRNSVSVDWSVREAVRAKLRLMVKKILREHHYPPDLQEGATKLVLEQAEKLSEHWVVA